MSTSRNQLLPKIIQAIHRLGESEGSRPSHIIENLHIDLGRTRSQEKTMVSRIRTALKSGVKDGVLIYNSGKYKVNSRKYDRYSDYRYYRNPRDSRYRSYASRGIRSRRQRRPKRRRQKLKRRRNTDEDEEVIDTDYESRESGEDGGGYDDTKRHRDSSPEVHSKKRVRKDKNEKTEVSDEEYVEDNFEKSPAKRTTSKASKVSKVSRVSRKSRTAKHHDQAKEEIKKSTKSLSRKPSRPSSERGQDETVQEREANKHSSENEGRKNNDENGRSPMSYVK